MTRKGGQKLYPDNAIGKTLKEEKRKARNKRKKEKQKEKNEEN